MLKVNFYFAVAYKILDDLVIFIQSYKSIEFYNIDYSYNILKNSFPYSNSKLVYYGKSLCSCSFSNYLVLSVNEK